MKWPSFVRYWLVSGFGDAVTLVGQVVDVEHARARDGHAHRPQPGRHQRDVDDDALPVRSRWNRAAPMPPASAMPDCRSPKPGPGIGEGNSWPGGVTPIAAPERPQ